MLTLYIPKMKDYWYEQKLLSDKETMKYNAGYDVSYFGYDYDTGCIDFPKSRWQDVYDKRVNEKRFFAYLKDTDTNKFIGYVYYHFNKNNNRYECGIVIESIHRGKGYSKEGLKILCDKAKQDGVDALYDNFEEDRNNIKIFADLGFKVVEKTSWLKFNRSVCGIIVKKDL